MDKRMENLEHQSLWRRQCARNIMDCYALAMEASMETQYSFERGPLQSLTRWMVEGMTSVKTREDEKAFYGTAARLCRECSDILSGRAWEPSFGEKGRSFRIYGSIFDDLSR